MRNHLKKFLMVIICISFIFLLFRIGLGNRKTLKIGFIYIGPVGDAGWTYSHEQSRLRLMRNYPEIQTFMAENVSVEMAEHVMKDMIDKGVTAIFATSFDYAPVLKNFAPQYPDVHFFHCSGVERPAKNITTYFGRIYQPLYLAGYLAATMSRTNVIGFVAPKKIPIIIRYINAFVLGAQKADPNIQVNVIWIGEWYNPEKAKKLTIEMVRQKADVFLSGGDSAAPLWVALNYHIYAIGSNADLSKIAPNHILTSVVWNWMVFYDAIIPKLKNRSWKGKDLWWGLKENAVQLSPISRVVPITVSEDILQLKTDIKEEHLNVFAGPVYDQDGKLRIIAGKVLTDNELLKMDWLVQGVRELKD